MRPADLPSVQQLGARKPHGHKMRYMAGCRCRKCRAANAAYEQELTKNRRLHGPNDLVATTRVYRHLKYLQQFGMGHKTVARHAKVGKTVLAEILWYGKKLMRRRAEMRVLAVQSTLDTLPRNRNIPAVDTITKIRHLIRWGYPKALINRDALGLQGAGLQIHSLKGKTGTVTVKSAVKIRDFFARVETIRRLWVQAHGPIPRGQYVYWKKGRSRCTLRVLELRPFSTGYNYHYLYPPNLKSAIKLSHQIKMRLSKGRRSDDKNEKHDGRSTRSSFCHSGSTPG
jgi:hypothetical protein